MEVLIKGSMVVLKSGPLLIAFGCAECNMAFSFDVELATESENTALIYHEATATYCLQQVSAGS